MHIVRRFHCCKLALTFPPFPPCPCLHSGAWQPCAWCGSKHRGRQEVVAQGNPRQKGRSAKDRYQMRWRDVWWLRHCERHYSLITMLYQNACPWSAVSKQSSAIKSCVKWAEEACYSNDSYKATFIYQRLHSFICSFIQLTNMHLFRTLSRALG